MAKYTISLEAWVTVQADNEAEAFDIVGTATNDWYDNLSAIGEDANVEFGEPEEEEDDEDE